MTKNGLVRLLANVKDLVETTCAGRDELYAASLTIEDQSKSASLRQLSEELRRHAIELQDLLSDFGISIDVPVETAVQSRAFFAFAKQRNGTEEILRIVANCYRIVKDEYDSVLDSHPENAITVLLRRQCDVVDAGEAKLKAMRQTKSLQDVRGREPRFTLPASTVGNRFRAQRTHLSTKDEHGQ